MVFSTQAGVPHPLWAHPLCRNDVRRFLCPLLDTLPRHGLSFAALRSVARHAGTHRGGRHHSRMCGRLYTIRFHAMAFSPQELHRPQFSDISEGFWPSSHKEATVHCVASPAKPSRFFGSAAGPGGEVSFPGHLQRQHVVLGRGF